MRLLLDTHVLLWFVKDDKNLSKNARKIINDATEVYVSSASIWEAAIKIKLNKLNVDLHDLIDAITESGFLELPISVRHTAEIINLPDIHKDPFDRILLSQAITEPLRLVTADSILSQYSELVTMV